MLKSKKVTFLVLFTLVLRNHSIQMLISLIKKTRLDIRRSVLRFFPAHIPDRFFLLTKYFDSHFLDLFTFRLDDSFEDVDDCRRHHEEQLEHCDDKSLLEGSGSRRMSDSQNSKAHRGRR